MTEISPQDLRHFEREYDRLAVELRDHYNIIIATERLIIAGAAAVVAFLYTGLPNLAEGQARVISALPMAIVVLGGLRCLSLFLVMLSHMRYMQALEGRLMVTNELGVQRTIMASSWPEMKFIIASTTAFWLFAVSVCAYFALAYEPATAPQL